MATDKEMMAAQLEELDILSLGDKFEIKSLMAVAVIFVALCFINVPLAFLYTTLFVCFTRVKTYNPIAYETFIFTSVSILAYFVILYVVLQIIFMLSDNPVGIITHNGRFPLFYML
jgi:hypothetical protein